MDDTVIRIGGAAGDGVQSAGNTLARSFSRLGWHVHALNSYQSVIRGGHVWYGVRVARDRVLAHGDAIDVLVAIDRQTAEVHAPLLREGGVVVHDEEKVKLDGIDLPKGVRELAVPARAAAKEIGSPLVANTVALGAVAHVVGLPVEGIEDAIRAQFGHKGEKIIQMNHDALEKGRDAARAITPMRDHARVGEGHPFMIGNEALALGALAGGLGYYAAYPMTPATGILHYLANTGPQVGCVVKQVEDEIGVVNSTIGAAWAGARAMCGTSGGGFALMSEAVSYAGMGEIGLVIVNSMRGGPSTGLPTKTEQADLWQMLGAGQGDYPKAIIAPESPEDAYHAAAEALDIADKYQMPVLLAMDFYLSESGFTVPKDALASVTAIDRGAIGAPDGDGARFLRYKVTDSGVSPRTLPGMQGGQFIAASDEHDEDSTLISDVRAGLPDALQVRVAQVEKRARKLTSLLAELPAPRVEGDTGPILVCWGSTAPILRDARGLLAERGVHTRQLTLKYVHPFHSDAVKTALDGEDFVMVELSHSGQFEDYLRMRTGLTATGHVRRFDGEPLTPGWVADRVTEVLQ